MVKNPIYSQITYVLLGLGFLLLGWTNITQDQLHFDDEVWYLENVALLEQYGFSTEFLLAYKGSAGPLFASVHYLLQPLTGLQAPGLHMVNFAFLGLTILVLSFLLKMVQTPEAGRESLFLLAIPMTYVCAGMVLTEMPAMFFLVLTCWMLVKWKREEENETAISWMWLVGAGISFSLAILGRQIYLILLPLMWILMLPSWPTPSWGWAKVWVPIGLFSILSLALPARVFYTWQGLTSIADAAIYAEYAERGISYAPMHVLFALGYMAIIALLIAPGWFAALWKSHYKAALLGIAFLICVGNLYFGLVEYYAVEGIARQYLPEGLLPYYGRGVGAILLLLASAFVITAFLHGKRLLEDRLFVVAILACLGIAFTSLKITHQFSSRYVAQAAPFLIILLARFPVHGWWGPVGKGIGVALGLASLYSYFQ